MRLTHHRRRSRRRRRRPLRPGLPLLVLLVSLLAASSGLGVAAVSTAGPEGPAPVVEPTGATGSIELVDGTAGDAIRTDSDGRLDLDLARGPAAGLAVGGRYRYGDPARPVSLHAFAIVNRGDRPHRIAVEYTVADGSGVGVAGPNVAFLVHNPDGTHALTVTEEGTGGTVVAAPGASLPVVIVVDTRGLPRGPGADLSGTLSVTAT